MTFPRLVVAFVVVCALANIQPSGVHAQTTSDFLPSAPTSNWFNAANWSAGIPNGAGDVAQFNWTTPTRIVDLTAPATVGQLQVNGTGAYYLLGASPLTFDRPGAEPARMQLTGRALTAIIEPALAIAAGEELVLDTSVLTTLTRGFAAGNGKVTRTGSSTLTLSNGNANWAGDFVVNGGITVVNHANALGGTAGRTYLNAGTLRLDQATAETVVFGGGTLTATASRDMNGGLVVPAGVNGIVAGPLQIKGGSSGEGNLEFRLNGLASVSGTPLAHAGDLIVTTSSSTPYRMDLNVDSTYAGKTKISGTAVNANTPGALGSAAEGTTVTNGTLRLHSQSLEPVELKNSTLTLTRPASQTLEQRYEGSLTLDSSVLDTPQYTSGGFSVALAQPVKLAGGDSEIAPQRGRLRLIGGVTGAGNLLINPSEAEVLVEGMLDFAGDLELRGGIVRFQQPQDFAGVVTVRNGGRLVAETDLHLPTVQSGQRDESCCNPFAQIEAAPGKSLTVDRLEISTGHLQGDIRTNGAIRFRGFNTTRSIQNLSSGVDVVLEAGQMIVEDANPLLGATTGAMVVGASSNAAIVVKHQRTYEADFFLNDGTGFNYGGALVASHDGVGNVPVTIRGDIHLGEQGAVIGSDGGPLVVKGHVYGGDLILAETSNVILQDRVADYTGKTRLGRYSQLTLSNGGKLADTSQIQLGSSAVLAIDVGPGEGPIVDYIADDVPIELSSGEISVWPSDWGVVAKERLGKVTLVRGQSNIKGGRTNRGTNDPSVDVAIGELVREPGALLTATGFRDRYTTEFIRQNDVYPVGPILENQIPLVNGVLPAWIQAHRGNFSTYSNGRIVGYQESLASFSEADETSIVGQQVTATLTADRTVHGIAYVEDLKLNGKTLTVGSGGVFNTKISGGTVLPGAHSGGELVFYNATINATIADNGAPTTVIYTGDSDISGQANYTGKTYFIGRPGDNAEVQNTSALPANGDLDIQSAGVYLREATNYQLGTVQIRDGGSLSIACCGNGATLAAEKIELEDGRLTAKLNGDVPVEKTSPGMATMGEREAAPYTGKVDVREGLLLVEHYPSLGSGTIAVHAGGRVAFGPDFDRPAPTGEPLQLNLAGGALYGAGANDYAPNFAGAINVLENSQIYLINGVEKRLLASDIVVEGSINVAPGKSLEVIGWSAERWGPSIRVTDGVHLGEGAVLGGTGGMLGEVEISNGAVLSPGLSNPGSSLGELSMVRSLSDLSLVSSMTWGEGGRYRWEINDTDGEAGAVFGRGWDLMRVDGTLTFAATPEAPFVIELFGLGLDGLPGDAANLAPNETFHWAIAKATSIVGFDPASVIIDASHFSQLGFLGKTDGQQAIVAPLLKDWSVSLEGDMIYLTATAVPEPGGCWLAAIGLLGGGAGFRRRFAMAN